MIDAVPTTLADAALWYASHGWHVLPINENTKQPYPGGRGYLDATTDAVQIASRWSRHHAARIGLSLRASGLVAVDVDVSGGKQGAMTLAALEAKLGPLPRTCVQRSGGGGLHIVMRDPSPGLDGWTRTHAEGGSARGNFDGLGCGPHVDLKINGFIVLAPSGSYRWLALDFETIPEVPPAWAEAMRKPALAAVGDHDIDDWRASIKATLDPRDAEALRAALRDLGPRASGNSTTFRALRLVHHDFGLAVEDGAAFVAAWSANCGKQLTDDELDRQLHQSAERDASGYPRGHARKHDGVFSRVGLAPVPSAPTPVARNPEPTPSPATGPVNAAPALADQLAAIAPLSEWERDVATALSDVTRVLGTSTDQGAALPLFISATDLLAMIFTEDPWLVHGLAKRGGTIVISGEPKCGKSWALTELAIAVCSGTLAFGTFATGEPQRGAYFYAEDLAADVQSHLRALAVGRGMSPAEAVKNLFVQPRGRFLDVLRDADLAVIVASVRRLGGVDLLCLEPLRDLHSGEEDKSDSMREVMRRLRVLGELLDCTIAVAHHAGKASADSGKRRGGQKMRGSGAIHGSVDSGLYLSAPRGDGPGHIAVRCESEVKGARSGGHFDLDLRIEDDAQGRAVKATWVVTREGASSKTDDTEDVAGIAEQHMHAVMHAIAVAEARNANTSAVELRNQVGGGKGALDSALGEATRRGLICKKFRGRKHAGWKLTVEGHAILASAVHT